jgi:PHD and RING finger domain-containing protein 1
LILSEWETDEEVDDSQDVTLVTSDDDGEGGENCPICLNKFRDQDIGTPESCDHCFCLECIQEWANVCGTNQGMSWVQPKRAGDFSTLLD